jgi:hypothetical protein
VIPPDIAAPAPPRRATPPAFRLLDQGDEEKARPAPKPRRRKHRGPWLKRLVILGLLAGVVGGGYWYFVLKNPGKPPPWAGLVDKAKKLVSRSTQPPARRPAPPPRAPRTTAPRPAPAPAATPPPTAAGPASPPPAPVTVAQPTPPPVASPFARFDRLSDSLTRAVRSFQERAALFDSGRMDCNGLANGLVAVETMWMTYYGERTARLQSLDQPRVQRDQSLYAYVDNVARRFEASGCPRP